MSDGPSKYTLIRCQLGIGATVDAKALEFAPDNLAALVHALAVGARASLEKEVETTNFPPMSEQYYRLALAALEQAESFARLADYNLTRGD